jgi:hypothetical protein
MYNSVESARLILPLMSNIDVSDKQGRSALSKASFHGNLQVYYYYLLQISSKKKSISSSNFV